MSELYYIIFLPIAAGILLFAIPEKLRTIKGIAALLVSLVALVFAVRLYNMQAGIYDPELFSDWFVEGTLFQQLLEGLNKYSSFNIDNLARLITLATCGFSVLVTIYSLSYMTRQKAVNNYYAYLLLTTGLTAGAALTDNLLFLLAFWGILGITLYKLIRGYDAESSEAAKKTLIIIGASDGVMILGIAIIWRVYGTLSMSELDIPTSFPLLVVAFLSLLIGSFTKAGAFPLHTWIPDYARYAPASSSAFLPASLDKLLGIYFMARICIDIFRVNEWLTFLMLLLGVLTITCAVMMALIQHNYKRLLGYHAVSQVGYMVVGLALGTPLGIAGGLFHMLNHALYKSGLFLSAGNVEKATGKEYLDDVGGLSKYMPMSFIAALTCALAISGVPPLNGFASKWLIYQGIIDFGTQPGLANQVWFVWLGLAVLGSALTLASFIKFITGIFLGEQKKELAKTREVSILMWLPAILIALACILGGIFGSTWVVPKIFMPLYGEFEFLGVWPSATVSLLILVSIVLGILVYLLGKMKDFRTDHSFIGGEIKDFEPHFSVIDFYKTLRDFRLLGVIYDQAEKKWFDIYDICRNVVNWSGKWLAKAHTGILTAYAIWIFAGLVILMIILLQL